MPCTKSTIGTHCTTVHDDNGVTVCTYHRTAIAKFHRMRGVVELNNGGWSTVTTKRRMNECLAAWGSRWRVFQKDHTWYVSAYLGDGKHGEPREYFNGIEVPAG